MGLDEVDQVTVLFVRNVIDHRDFGESADHTKHPSAFRPLIWK